MVPDLPKWKARGTQHHWGASMIIECIYMVDSYCLVSVLRFISFPIWLRLGKVRGLAVGPRLWGKLLFVLLYGDWLLKETPLETQNAHNIDNSMNLKSSSQKRQTATAPVGPIWPCRYRWTPRWQVPSSLINPFERWMFTSVDPQLPQSYGWRCGFICAPTVPVLSIGVGLHQGTHS